MLGEWIVDSLRTDLTSTQFVLDKAVDMARSQMKALQLASTQTEKDGADAEEPQIDRLVPVGNLVHLYQSACDDEDSYLAAVVPGDSSVMRLRGSYSFLKDHEIEGYRDALQSCNKKLSPRSPSLSAETRVHPKFELSPRSPPPPPAQQKTWQRYADPSRDGKAYWHCVETNETTWEPQHQI